MRGTLKILAAALFATTCQSAFAAHAPDDELVETGRVQFAASCGFCHGRDAQGGSTGLDLTRSDLVAKDKAGELIGEVLRSGRIDKGMPAFDNITGDELKAIAAFVHRQKTIAESANGQRRSVEPGDLATGDAGRGKRYFASNCASCHAADGDLKGIATRVQGLSLLRRMLYPGSEGRGGARKPASVSVTTGDGARFDGALAYRDEFTIALREADGSYRSWPVKSVTLRVENPLDAHFDQLGRYTDRDMHDVLAYLLTLR